MLKIPRIMLKMTHAFSLALVAEGAFRLALSNIGTVISRIFMPITQPLEPSQFPCQPLPVDELKWVELA